MSKRHSTSIYAGGKVVGHVENDSFVKKVRASKHMLRSPRGWALDVQSLKDAEEIGAKFVELHDSDSGKTYRASIERIWEKGISIDRGYGKQQVTLIGEWNIEGPGVRQLALIP